MSKDDAELIALGLQFERAWIAQRVAFDVADGARPLSDDDSAALLRPCCDLVDLILTMEARTFAGFGVKALAFAWCHGSSIEDVAGDETIAGRLLVSIMRGALARRSEEGK